MSRDSERSAGRLTCLRKMEILTLVVLGHTVCDWPLNTSNSTQEQNFDERHK